MHMPLTESAQRIYYHASFDPITKFWPLSHFGTYKAAISRMIDVLEDIHDDGYPFEDRPIYIHAVRLNIQNPLKTVDVYNERPYIVPDVAAHVMSTMHKKLTPKQSEEWHKLLNVKTTPKNTQKLQSLLAELGHDGLTYRNKVEDVGHYSMINLSSDQVQMTEPPQVIQAKEIYQLPKRAIWESDARPAELGEAYFWHNRELHVVHPYRNHRDWLIAHVTQLALPEYVCERPQKALWESYKLGMIRLVWDPQGAWKKGAGAGTRRVLYVNGTERSVWQNVRGILNDATWAGNIHTVIMEYVRDVDGKPDWYHTDIFTGGDLEALYRGKRARRSVAPADAIWGGEPDQHMVAINRCMNEVNQLPGAVFEQFQAHVGDTGFWHTVSHTPRNGYQIWPSHRFNGYLGLQG